MLSRIAERPDVYEETIEVPTGEEPPGPLWSDWEARAEYVRKVVEGLLRPHFDEGCGERCRRGCPSCDRYNLLDRLLTNPYELED